MIKTCEQCKKPFNARAAKAKFCGAACYAASRPYTLDKASALFWSKTGALYIGRHRTWKGIAAPTHAATSNRGA